MKTNDLIDSYIDKNAWKIQENSNIGYSLMGLNNFVTNDIIKEYWMYEIYDRKIRKAHNDGVMHIHDLSSISVYCVGWDLYELLKEGFKGARGKIESKPAKHFSTALMHVVNFIFTLQGESAGAQALSNFDTLLAPFVKYDNLTYKQVEQELQQFIYNMNVSTRVGGQCISEDTEILTINGWKTYNDVEIGDEIYSYNLNNDIIEKTIIDDKFVADYDDTMYRLYNRSQEQLITPRHKVVRKIYNSDNYKLDFVEDLLTYKTPIMIPTWANNNIPDFDILDEEIELAAWIIAEGTIDNNGSRPRISIYQSKIVNRKHYDEIKYLLDFFNLTYHESSRTGLGKPCVQFRINTDSTERVLKLFDNNYNIKHVPKDFLKMSQKQAYLFLETYVKADGSKAKNENRKRIITTDIEILNGLEYLAVIAGYNFNTKEKKLHSPLSKKKQYCITLTKTKHDNVKIEKINYTGKIWCVHSNNETLIAKRNGQVFITGNSPFSNITLDMVCPEHFNNIPVLSGGLDQEDTYDQFQREMDIINKVFAKLMTEGDSLGRPFSISPDTMIPYYEDNVVKIKEISKIYDECKEINGENDKMCNSINFSYSKFDKEIFTMFNNYSIIGKGNTILKHKYKGKLLHIKTDKNKIIKVSPSHSLFTIDDNHDVVETKCGELKKGDIIVTFKNINLPEQKQYIKYNNYEKVWEKGIRGCQSISKKAKIEIDEDLAWLLGCCLGDGWISKDVGKMSFAAANIDDYNIITNKVKKVFNEDPINSSKKDNVFEVRYCKKYLAEVFKFKLEKKIPNELWNCDINIKKAFWDGLYFADGTTKGCSFKQRNNKLLRELQIFLLSIGITTSVNFEQEKKGESNYLIQGKDNRIKNLLKNKSGKLTCRYNSQNFYKVVTKYPHIVNNFVDKDINVNTISNIEEIDYDGMLYDITSNGNFMDVNGVLYHNTFPIPTVNLTKDFNWDSTKLDPIWENTAKRGSYYFSNFINSDMKPEDARSLCCRLRLSTKELMKRGGGLFGSNGLTGSTGVVTINMNQLGYLSKDKPDFFRRLARIMDLAKESLILKRETIENLADGGLYPYSTYYLKNVHKRFGKYWANHFSTIGLIGLNDAIYTMFGKTIGDEEGIEFAKEVLNFMREKLIEYQEETGDLFNLEATPAEGTAYRLAKIDRRLYPDIKIYSSELNPGTEEYYTNSSQLPVGYSENISEVLDKQDAIQSLYTGGTVVHIFASETNPNPLGVKKLIRNVAEQYTLPYFTFSPTQSICPVHKFISGEHKTCPTCGEECDVITRVVGFFRPTNQWNAGKRQEFEDRKMFKI